MMNGILDDACVALSLLLQHGVEPDRLAASMGRNGDYRPASIIGPVVDLLVVGEERPSRASPTGSADAVPIRCGYILLASCRFLLCQYFLFSVVPFSLYTITSFFFFFF